MTKLLITKSNLSDAELQAFSHLDLDLISKSFIDFEAVDFSVRNSEHINWIFFSSPRAFDFFRAKVGEEYIKEKKIACVGRKTAEHISKEGIPIQFTGQKSGDIPTVARALRDLVKQEGILFPISNLSNQSMQKELLPEQCNNLIVYRTIIIPEKIKENTDLIVFTSPSNVNGYLAKNAILPQQKLIAWGSTTKEHLKNTGYSCSSQLEESSIESLIHLLETDKSLLA